MSSSMALRYATEAGTLGVDCEKISAITSPLTYGRQTP